MGTHLRITLQVLSLNFGASGVSLSWSNTRHFSNDEMWLVMKGGPETLCGW